ncbi:MAG: radical SAM protein [Thermotaleaceae bacterium]
MTTIGDIGNRIHAFEVFGDYFAFVPSTMDLFGLSRSSYLQLKNGLEKDRTLIEGYEYVSIEIAELRALAKAPESRYREVAIVDEVTLCMFLTHACNLSCEYCFDDSARRKYGNSSLQLDNAFKTIEDILNQKDNMNVWFFGGEPLLEFHKIKRIVAYCQDKVKENPRKKIGYMITTNGLLLNTEIVNFLERYNFAVTLSMDDCDKEDETIGKNNADLLQMLIPRQERIMLTLRPTVTRDRFRNTRDMFWRFRKKGVKNVLICPAFDKECKASLSQEDAKLFMKQLQKIIGEVIASGNREDIQAFMLLSDYFFHIKNKIIREQHCGAGKYIFALDVDGQYYPCQRYASKELKAISEIKCSPSSSSIVCRECWAYPLCGGNSCSFNKDIKIKDNRGFCFLNKSMIELACWAYSKVMDQGLL